jgi:hypothetical protein
MRLMVMEVLVYWLMADQAAVSLLIGLIKKTASKWVIFCAICG